MKRGGIGEVSERRSHNCKQFGCFGEWGKRRRRSVSVLFFGLCVGVLVLVWEGEGKGGVEDSGEDSVDWYRMPEYPKVLSQEICENISDLFPQRLDTGSLLFCNNSHGGAGAVSVESGGISVLGKKRHSQLEFVDGKRCRNMGLGHAKDDRKMTTPQPSLELLGASTGLKASPAASTLKPLIDTPSNQRCCNVILSFV